MQFVCHMQGSGGERKSRLTQPPRWVSCVILPDAAGGDWWRQGRDCCEQGRPIGKERAAGPIVGCARRPAASIRCARAATSITPGRGAPAPGVWEGAEGERHGAKGAEPATRHRAQPLRRSSAGVKASRRPGATGARRLAPTPHVVCLCTCWREFGRVATRLAPPAARRALRLVCVTRRRVTRRARGHGAEPGTARGGACVSCVYSSVYVSCTVRAAARERRCAHCARGAVRA